MAGIFANIDSDISKLNQLKSKIEEVKKALQKINVKVDIDIAQNLESRLKGLMTQYDALAQKVAQTEAKIAESTERINKSAETIVKAQEQMTKAAVGQGAASTQGVSGGNAAATNAQTASVEAQAKAYDELKDAIEDYLGTMEGNARFIAESRIRIKAINSDISAIEKSIKSQGHATEAQTEELAKYIKRLAEAKLQMQDARREFNTGLRINVAGEGSLAKLRNQLLQMQRVWDVMAESVRNSQIGQEFAKSIDVLNKQVSELEQTMGRYQRNVGNYASGWNGLNVSIQQIGRELPSLAMGWNTFFLAISNNLPILTDEIKRAKDEYNNLKKSGQQATPVWKQVVSSLLSWQTALTVGITLLTMYGDDILKWVGNLFKAKDGTEELTEAMKRMNTAISGVYSSASNEMRVLKELNTSLENAKRGTEEWNQIRNRIITGYSKYLPSIDQEIQKTGTLASSYDKLAESIQKAAAARGFEEYSSESNKKYMDERNKRIEEVYDAMIDELGNDEGNKLYQEWLKVLDSGMRPTRSQAGKFGNIGVGFGLGNANSVLIDLQNLLDANNETIDKFRKMFGMTEGAEEDLPSDSIKAIQERITANREALEKLSTSSQEYRNLLQVIQKDEERLQKLTMKPAAQSKQYNSIQDQQDKINELLDKQSQERIKQQVEMENRVAQAEIDAMADGAEKVRAQRELDNKKELEEIIRQKNEYIKEQINAQKEIFDAQEELKANQDTKYKKQAFDASSVNVDTSSFDMLFALTQARQISDYFNEQEKAMNRYLQDYGTFQKKSEAITEEYNRKIAEAGGADTWEGKALQKQMEEALSSLDLEKLKKSINWELVFSDLSNASKESLDKVKQQLKTFKESDEYQNMAVDQKKVIDEALDNIQSAIIDKGGLLGDLPNQLEELAKAQEELTKAQDEYNEALKNGTDEQKEAAQGKLNKARQNLANQYNNVNKATGRAVSNFQLLSGTLTELGEASEMSLTQLGNLVQGIAVAFGDSGNRIGGIIGSVFSLLDSIGSQGLDGFVGNVFKSIGNAAYGAWDTLFGWTGIDFGGDSDPHLEEDLQRLAQSNQDLEAALDNLSSKMDDSSVAEAMGIYSQQVANINEQMRNTQEAMLRSHAASSNGFMGIGGDHSSGYEINQGVTASEWQEVSRVVGKTVRDAEDFFNLTSEEMWRVANEATPIYSKIKDLADNGYRDAAQYMDEYISYWQQLEEIQNDYREKLTSTSFDSIKEDFRSALLDMEDSTEKFAENFEKMMQQAMIESLMTEKYDTQLKAWYKLFSNYMKDGTLSSVEQLFLSSMWQGIVDDASAEWQGLKDLMGWGNAEETQQSATTREVQQITYDQASHIEGRLNAMYEAQLRGLDVQKDIYNISDEVRSIIAQSYLELQQISENTGEIIKPIKQMQLDIAEVKKNTSKL